jgi:hypothetical protein
MDTGVGEAGTFFHVYDVHVTGRGRVYTYEPDTTAGPPALGRGGVLARGKTPGWFGPTVRILEARYGLPGRRGTISTEPAERATN